MLVLKVEVWPGGNEHRAQCIGKMHLVNTYQPADWETREVVEFPPVADYQGEAFAYDSRYGADVKTWRFKVIQHDRRNGFWALVCSALQTMMR